MRVLVIGATGGTGRQLVAQALERGHEVTAFVRDPDKLRLRPDGLTVAQGDVLEYRSVEVAVQQQQAVLCALGHKQWLGPTRVLSQGTEHVVRAMTAWGIRRLVCETSLGLGESFGRLGLYYTLFVIPVILPFYYWDKRRQEKIVRDSTLDWTIVRPGALTDGSKRGNYRHGPQVGSFVATARISRADVAAFMLDQLTDDAYLRATPGVCW